MACKKLQSMENEFTIANARLEELESSTPGNYNIEELFVLKLNVLITFFLSK